MDSQFAEIAQIPQRAIDILENDNPFRLPPGVPYLGMGSSYFAALAFKYMGVEIFPEMASEFYQYPLANQKFSKAVIISQSGRSSEALWCAQLFKSYIAISNYTDSALCTLPNVDTVIPLLAGDEQYSSSKTYVNTLIALFKGFGYHIKSSVDLMVERMLSYEETGQKMAGQVYDLLATNKIHGIYIIGSGPNIATALQAALILSESTKRNFDGMPMAQYDHGPKETAKDSIVIQIIARGKSYERSVKLGEKISMAGAHVFTVEEPEAEENYSIINNIVPFNFMAYYLAKKLNITETFSVGGKVTEVL